MDGATKVIDPEVLDLLKKRLSKGDSLIFHIKSLKKENKVSYDASKGEFILEIKEKPIEGKANKEVVGFLHMLTKKRVKIISGLKSKTKKIKFY